MAGCIDAAPQITAESAQLEDGMAWTTKAQFDQADHLLGNRAPLCLSALLQSLVELVGEALDVQGRHLSSKMEEHRRSAWSNCQVQLSGHCNSRIVICSQDQERRSRPGQRRARCSASSRSLSPTVNVMAPGDGSVAVRGATKRTVAPRLPTWSRPS